MFPITRVRKWDPPDMQSWFIPQDKQSARHLGAFMRWLTGLPESQQSFSKNKIAVISVMEDPALGLGDD